MKTKACIKNYKYFLNTPLGKKFVNCLMIGGKKSKAEKILLESLFLIRLSKNKNPISLLLLSLKNVKPVVEVRSVRVYGSSYQVPVPLTENRKISLAMKWIVFNSRKTLPATIKNRFRNEIVLSAYKQGESVKKKLAVHRLAIANRAFAHYRWF
jgi:small subunit ribosomal protein S7